MHLFHLSTARGQGEPGAMTTWLVVADALFDAFVLVPESNTVKAVRVESGAGLGPERLIGCAEPKFWAKARHEEEALGPAIQHRRNGWIVRRRG